MHLAAPDVELLEVQKLGRTHEARNRLPTTTIRRAFSTMSQLGIRIEY